MDKNFLKRNKIGIFILSRYNSKRLKKKANLEILGKNLTELLLIRLLKKFNKESITICSSNFNTTKNFITKLRKNMRWEFFLEKRKMF